MKNDKYIKADYVLLFGKIYTLDKYSRICTSIAINDGKIIFVGSNIDAFNYIGPKTKVINLKGKMVLPSFSDSNMYPLGNILTENYDVNLSDDEKAKYYPKLSDEQYIDSFLKFQTEMHSLGITSISSVYINSISDFTPYRIYEKLIKENKLKLRVAYSENIHPNIEKDGHLVTFKEQIDDLVSKRAEIKDKSPYFKFTSGNIYMDNFVHNKSDYLCIPDENNSLINLEENYKCNLWQNNKDDLKFVITELNNLGFQARFHSIDSESIKFILDIFEEVSAPNNYLSRNLLNNIQSITKEDIQRIRKFKLIASLGNLNDKEASYEYQLKSLLDEKVLVSGASYSPLSLSPNPIISMQKYLSKNFYDAESNNLRPTSSINGSNYLLSKDNLISVMDIIRIFTKNSAYANFMDDEIGSLEVNKRADLIVLDTNLLEMNISELHKANVLMTFFDGEIVYIKQGFNI